MTKLWLSYRTTNLLRFMIIIIFFENMVIDAFLACLFNVHYLIFLSMVYEYAYFCEYIWKSVYRQWRKSRGGQGDTSPQMSDGEGTVMHHVPPPNMAEISLHKRQRIHLYLLNYVIVLLLSNISCLQLCQMFYRGQLCELYFQILILDHKQRRPP